VNKKLDVKKEMEMEPAKLALMDLDQTEVEHVPPVLLELSFVTLPLMLN
jgi:hypothetical protein